MEKEDLEVLESQNPAHIKTDDFFERRINTFASPALSSTTLDNKVIKESTK